MWRTELTLVQDCESLAYCFEAVIGKAIHGYSIVLHTSRICLQLKREGEKDNKIVCARCSMHIGVKYCHVLHDCCNAMLAM